MVEAVIFDMDGVIIDSEPLHFASDKMTMLDFGFEITDEELNQYVGVSNIIMWAQLRNKYGIPASVEELLQRQMHHKILLFGDRRLQSIDGTESLLRRLRNSGIKIGLASSSPRDFIQLILNTLDVDDYFDVIVSGEEVVKSKPAPDIFLRASELLNVHPSNCLVIEDSGHGVKAAKDAGMICIGYINPNSGVQDLSLSDRQVKSIRDIDYKME